MLRSVAKFFRVSAVLVTLGVPARISFPCFSHFSPSHSRIYRRIPAHFTPGSVLSHHEFLTRRCLLARVLKSLTSLNVYAIRPATLSGCIPESEITIVFCLDNNPSLKMRIHCTLILLHDKTLFTGVMSVPVNYLPPSPQVR